MLYHQQLLPEAIPKDISRRTSYHGIRLAFHPYPQLIRAFFNIHRFGPPPRVNKASPWSWLDHPASGLINETGRPFKTRFRYGSTPQTGLNLASFNNSPDHYAKGTRLHCKAPVTRKPQTSPHSATTDRRHTVSGTFSLPFRGAFHLSLTVLFRYRSSVCI